MPDSLSRLQGLESQFGTQWNSGHYLMTNITPLGLIEGLDQDPNSTARPRKNSLNNVTPWDNSTFPSINFNNYHKHSLSQTCDPGKKPASRTSDSFRRVLNKISSRLDKSKIQTKQKSDSTHNRGKTISYTTIDASQIPNATIISSEDRGPVTKLKGQLYSSKKHLFRQKQMDIVQSQEQHKARLSEKLEKYQELRGRINRRKQVKPCHQGMVTREYPYPKQAPSTKAQILNFPLDLSQETTSLRNYRSQRPTNVTCNTFFSKHKIKRSYEDLIEMSVSPGNQWERLSELLELSGNLFSRAFKEHKYQ